MIKWKYEIINFQDNDYNRKIIVEETLWKLGLWYGDAQAYIQAEEHRVL